MKKNAFFALICLFCSVWAQAQNLATINGLVTSSLDGTPVPNQQVFAFTNDSINQVFGTANTDLNGTYSIELVIPAGPIQVFVTTLTYCDPLNPFALSVLELDLSNGGQATADFQVCVDSFPPLEECFVDFFAIPIDTLTFEFNSYYYSLVDSNVTPVSYLWDFGDGSPQSTDPTPTHTYAADGLYYVTLTITGSDGCVASTQYPIETSFHGFPDCMGYIMYNQTGTTTFDFSSTLYDATGMPIQAASYSWDFGDGNVSTDAAPTHTYNTEGVYTVQLHALTDDGCEVHACDVVFAMESHVDTFWYGCQAMFYASVGGFDANGNPINDPRTVSFNDWSLGGVVSWAWDFGDGATSNEQNPVHTYAQDGIYTVSLSITTVDGCESEAVYSICVGNNCWISELDCQALFLPIPDSLGGNGIQFLDFSISSLPINSWSWDFGDGTTSNEQNPYHVFAQPGIYAVSLSIEGDSCTSAITFELDTDNPWNFNSSGDPAKLGFSSNSVATKEATAAFESVKLFPNPAHNELSVAFSSKQAGEYTVRISDLTGKTVQTTVQTAVAGMNAARLNVGSLVSGLYMAEIRSGESVQTIKFVKE